MRWRRGAREQADPTDVDDVVEAPAVEGPRQDGPWDARERPGYDEEPDRADLGSLSVPSTEGVEIRLQADEKTGNVLAVMLVAEDGAAELRAFASPRNEDIWDDVRSRLAAEAGRRGGRSAEVEGPYGTALRLEVPAVNAEGQQVVQQSTVLGIAGPRWLLRVSLFGRPATDFRSDAPLETALRGVVVNRGEGPMAPAEALPLTLPGNARRLTPDS